MLFGKLKEKEVVNVATGKCLGYVGDIEFDECTGCIRSIIVPGPGKICGIFGRECEYVIEWKYIVRIGPDIVIVNICEQHPCNKC
ncbi:MAG: YlmC/YmxH family sporulation protein [Lachnospiraceae bacterium]